MVLISAFASTLSMEAFSTFKIFPRIGRIAWVLRFRAVFALPPAESPSTIKTSHSSGFLLSQLASFPLPSITNFDLESMLVFVFSSFLLIFFLFYRNFYNPFFSYIILNIIFKLIFNYLLIIIREVKYG